MAYEYEIKIPMWLEDGRWLNMNVDDGVLDELDEVYCKAKAWDNYEDSVRSLVSKHADENTDIEKEVRDILCVYMEDE